MFTRHLTAPNHKSICPHMQIQRDASYVSRSRRYTPVKLRKWNAFSCPRQTLDNSRRHMTPSPWAEHVRKPTEIFSVAKTRHPKFLCELCRVTFGRYRFHCLSLTAPYTRHSPRKSQAISRDWFLVASTIPLWLICVLAQTFFHSLQWSSFLLYVTAVWFNRAPLSVVPNVHIIAQHNWWLH
jgi:hypothetical protein